jgi:hypothetical protein
MYAHSWANTSCHRVKVLAGPVIGVGRSRAGQFAEGANFTGDVGAVWFELLTKGYGIPEVTSEHTSWNYVSVQK